MNANTETILTHPFNLRALDATEDGTFVQQTLTMLAACMGFITEPVIDTEDPNPEFMFTEDVDAAIEDFENYLCEVAEEDRLIAAFELHQEQEADYRQQCWE